MPGLPAVSPTWQRAFHWIERTLGGTIFGAERQARWRPAWFLDLAQDRAEPPLALYFRGNRGEADDGVDSLERETRVLQVLEAAWLRYLHRRIQRLEILLAPAMNELEGASIQLPNE